MFEAQGAPRPENGENNNTGIQEAEGKSIPIRRWGSTAVLIKTPLHLRAPLKLSATAVPNYCDRPFSESQSQSQLSSP